LDFSNQLVPYLTEQRYAGRLIYGGGDDVLAYTNLWEWDNWLWDIRQCFKGAEDPRDEFESKGNYWQWCKEVTSPVAKRPLFTMGSEATISFGVAIAHHSVPLAIALENLWEAEEKAKEHKSPNGDKKDAVQVRILYGNGNILESTAKFDVFYQWQQLINASSKLESAIFEQAAQVWSQHPAPKPEALKPWTQVFCTRRDLFKNDDDARLDFQQNLADFLDRLWQSTPETKLDREILNWLKLAAFLKRNRDIQLGEVS
jgi:CRISPR-associated protein Cmr2